MMNGNLHQVQLSRLHWAVVGCTVLLSTLFFRAFELQLVHGAKYLKQADNNRFYTHRVIAQRGVFLDRYKQPLVWNVPQYFALTDAAALYQQRRAISRDEALEIIASGSGQTVITDNQRNYRYGSGLSHVLGYVGEVTAEDLQRDPQLGVGQQIGKAGLEYSQEKTLRGVDGLETFEINATGKKLRKVNQTVAQAGQNVQTTLDPYLSLIAQKAFGSGKGGVIITDAASGEVLTLVSLPSFDPNLLSQTQVDAQAEKNRKNQIQQMFADTQKLFFNRLVAGAYPPGSVFKLVTALSGLESGHLDPSTTVNDEGVLKVGDYQFGNWYYRQYGRVEGTINLERAIARSNDIFFYKVAEWIGPDVLSQMAKQFGFGQKTGIELPAEARGLVPDPAWKIQTLNERWFLGDTYHYGIGQGNLLVTPVQIAQLTQALANQASLCNLTLLKKEEVKCQKLPIKDQDLSLVLRGMVDACSSGGTAYPFFPYNSSKVADGGSGPELIQRGAVACKTGTAEFGAANDQDYRKTHGWFTAVVDLSDWKRTVASSAGTPSGSSVLPDSAKTVASIDVQTKAFHDAWLWEVNQGKFPDRITITVLKESDEQNPYREGSKDAAPVAKAIVDWIVGKDIKSATMAASPSLESGSE
jgi:penicillin-binding protein 2